LVKLALCEEEAFGPFEILLAPSPALCAAFYAWHGFFLLFVTGARAVEVRIPAVAGKDPQAWRPELQIFSETRPLAAEAENGASPNGFVSGAIRRNVLR
jgi:hypothetical protein